MNVLTLKFNGVTRHVFGGPYRERPKHCLGVKMAKEVRLPCDISIPTEDFSVPDKADLLCGLKAVLPHIIKGRSVFVGCMGGVGRTGLFMAALVKVTMPSENPVEYVRASYNPHAVETTKQYNFVESLNTSDLEFRFLKASKYIKWYDFVEFCWYLPERARDTLLRWFDKRVIKILYEK